MGNERRKVFSLFSVWYRAGCGFGWGKSHACLSRADLTKSPNRDRGGDLRGADLTGADLSFADLTGADLSGADLTGADLRGTILVDLLNPLDNTINGVTVLTDVMWDERTDWGGFVPPRSAPIVPLGRCLPVAGMLER